MVFGAYGQLDPLSPASPAFVPATRGLRSASTLRYLLSSSTQVVHAAFGLRFLFRRRMRASDRRARQAAAVRRAGTRCPASIQGRRSGRRCRAGRSALVEHRRGRTDAVQFRLFESPAMAMRDVGSGRHVPAPGRSRIAGSIRPSAARDPAHAAPARRTGCSSPCPIVAKSHGPKRTDRGPPLPLSPGKVARRAVRSRGR